MTALWQRLRTTTPRRAAAGLARRGQSQARVLADTLRSTRVALPASSSFTRLLEAPTGPHDQLLTDGLAAAIELWRTNHFDILGSGWLDVTATAPPEAPRWDDPLAARARSLLPTDHRPIGWWVDHKSGFAWSPVTHHSRIRYGDVAGVDVKVPWELARAQHLPLVAVAAIADPRRGDEHAQLIQATIADFIAACPSRLGVNWACTMDVAIRAANWLVACDLLAAAGHQHDPAFLQVLGASIEEHARFIAGHLEWYAALRSNHYLANIAGLAVIAAYLPGTPQSTAWLQFSAAELAVALDEQFLPDGANFEGSTSYHRLSAEMVAWATLLLRRVPDIHARLTADVPSGLIPRASRHHVVDVARTGELLTPDVDDRLRAMSRFTRAVTTPSGHVAQVGDNDSGRFIMLAPSWTVHTARQARARYVGVADALGDDAAHPMIDVGDHRELHALIGGLTGDVGLQTQAPQHARWVVDLARGGALEQGPTEPENPASAPVTAGMGTAPPGIAATEHDSPAPSPAEPSDPPTVWRFPSPDERPLDDGVTLHAFANAGIYVWRGTRLWLLIRCGPVGQAGNGGHAHCDQLAIELWIDGQPWIRDPGTMTYTPDPATRNAYRSVGAHFAPWHPDGREPNPLDDGLFTMADTTQARVMHVGPRSFKGVHHGYGAPTTRQVQITPDAVIVTDHIPGVTRGGQHIVTEPGQLRLPAPVPHSPAYGLKERQP